MTPRPKLRPPSPERAQSTEAEAEATSGLARSILAAPTSREAARRVRDAERTHPGARDALVEELAGTVLRLLRVDARSALAAAERQAVAARGRPLLEARALWSRAHALTNLSRHAEAADHYARAASAYGRLGQPLLAARTTLGHVDALMYLGRYEEALSIGKAARSVLLRHGELRSIVGLETNLANILHRTDRPAASLRAYDRALRTARRLNDAQRSRWIQFNRANALVALGRFDEAEDLYRKVRSGAERTSESWVVALVDYSLGYLCV